MHSAGVERGVAMQRSSFYRNSFRAGRNFRHASETIIAHQLIWAGVVAEDGVHVFCQVVPSAATQNPRARARSFGTGRVTDRFTRIRSKLVLTPLPHIAVHVVEPPGIGRFAP